MSHGKACGGYAGAGASRFGRRRDDGSVGYKVLLACVGAYLRVKDESLRAVRYVLTGQDGAAPRADTGGARLGPRSATFSRGKPLRVFAEVGFLQ